MSMVFYDPYLNKDITVNYTYTSVVRNREEVSDLKKIGAFIDIAANALLVSKTKYQTETLILKSFI